MAGNGRQAELSPLQERAIEALLVSPTIIAAALDAGVPERTLRRWLAEDEDFREAYRRVREASFEHALSRLQARADAAANTLLREMTSKLAKPADRIRAARLVLEVPAKLLPPAGASAPASAGGEGGEEIRRLAAVMADRLEQQVQRQPPAPSPAVEAPEPMSEPPETPCPPDAPAAVPPT
jgi:hypothetical protein